MTGSQVDPHPAAQVEAMMRLLVESGDMTPMAVRQLRSVLPRVAVVRPTRDPWDDEGITDFVNAILEHSPDTWDGDEGASAIAEDFVGHAVDEVKRLGGCLHRWCGWQENESCDHGYLSEPVARDVAVSDSQETPE